MTPRGNKWGEMENDDTIHWERKAVGYGEVMIVNLIDSGIVVEIFLPLDQNGEE